MPPDDNAVSEREDDTEPPPTTQVTNEDVDMSINGDFQDHELPASDDWREFFPSPEDRLGRFTKWILQEQAKTSSALEQLLSAIQERSYPTTSQQPAQEPSASGTAGELIYFTGTRGDRRITPLIQSAEPADSGAVPAKRSRSVVSPGGLQRAASSESSAQPGPSTRRRK